jgi:hypothetical protein
MCVKKSIQPDKVNLEKYFIDQYATEFVTFQKNGQNVKLLDIEA